uniref:Uncharacterized protein n=1 Tax=Prolemur simus TaxID=1328070 RepID=A0A8C8ZX15_PROSS
CPQPSGHYLATRSSRMNSTGVVTTVHEALRKQPIREFLAEFLSTYVMMPTCVVCSPRKI